MLRAEDLMVGDYLTFTDVQNDSHCPKLKVVVIYGATNEILASVDGDPTLDRIDINDELCGIPLTPEILEKNGFKKSDEDLCVRYVSVSNIEKRLQTVIEFSFYGECVSADTLFKCWADPESCDGVNDIHICDLKYVHQLQHALRLCKIDKTIEL